MHDFFARLRSLLIWLITLPVFVAACAAIWLGSFVLRGRDFERLLKGGCRAVLFFAGVRVEVIGRENVVPGRQYVALMNHVNFFDPMVFQVAFPYAARGVEEESHFRWPVYGATLKRIGMFPIDRKDTGQAVEMMRRAADWLRRKPGFSFAVMPEGTRTGDGRLGPFKRGGFILAVETELDILPLVQAGAFEIARKGSLNIRPGKIVVTIAPPVASAGYSKETVGTLIDRVRRVFLDRLGESSS